jgi:hypothetical protein
MSSARATEIVVTEDHAPEAIRLIVRTLEFLRTVYCGGQGTDLFAVPPAHVGGAEDAPLPRRSNIAATDTFTNNSSVVEPCASSPHLSHRRVASLSPPPTMQYRRPYDSLCVPVSTLANKSVAGGLHAAQSAVSLLPFTTTLRKSGSKEPNAAPFILRVRLSKPKAGGLFNLASHSEVVEEWEFAFVKVRTPPVVGSSFGSCGSDNSPHGIGGNGRGNVGGNDSSAVFGPKAAPVAPTPLQHALGLAPYSVQPNDPGKLRDALHFTNIKAMQALDTFVVDELRVAPEIMFDVAIVPNERETVLCHHLQTTRTATPEPDQGAGGVVGAIGGSLASFWRRR